MPETQTSLDSITLRTECDHAGTVWRVHVIGLESLYEPGTWECTRCGDQWDQHPVITRLRQTT